MGGKLLNFKSFIDNTEKAVKFLAAVNSSIEKVLPYNISSLIVPFDGPIQNLIHDVLLTNEMNDTFYFNARSSNFISSPLHH